MIYVVAIANPQIIFKTAGNFEERAHGELRIARCVRRSTTVSRLGMKHQRLQRQSSASSASSVKVLGIYGG